MSIDDLIDLIDEGQTQYENLLNAITDWQVEVGSTEEYFNLVKEHTQEKELTIDVLTQILKKFHSKQAIWDRNQFLH